VGKWNFTSAALRTLAFVELFLTEHTVFAPKFTPLFAPS
jgi:hypothetical protein